MLQGEHSAILSTFILLPFVIKILFCLSLSGRLRQVFTVLYFTILVTITTSIYHYIHILVYMEQKTLHLPSLINIFSLFSVKNILFQAVSAAEQAGLRLIWSQTLARIEQLACHCKSPCSPSQWLFWTHLSGMEFPTLINWTSLFPF